MSGFQPWGLQCREYPEHITLQRNGQGDTRGKHYETNPALRFQDIKYFLALLFTVIYLYNCGCVEKIIQNRSSLISSTSLFQLDPGLVLIFHISSREIFSSIPFFSFLKNLIYR